MEQSRPSLPDKPASFDDYLAAAEQVANYAVKSNLPELRSIPSQIDNAYADTIDVLDEILAAHHGNEVSRQLVYGFAWKLFMEDSVVNSRGRYNDMLGIISMINQRYAERTNLSAVASGQVAYIEHAMHELAESLATESVAHAMDQAEQTIRSDNPLRNRARKVLVYLGLKDNEAEVIHQNPDNLSARGKKTMLEALALARERLLSGQQADLTEQSTEHESRIKNMSRKLLAYMGLVDHAVNYQEKPDHANNIRVEPFDQH